MPRNRLSRLLATLCLALLLGGLAAPVFAGPETSSPASFDSLWRALTTWIDGLITSGAAGEANLIPFPDPRGEPSTTSGGEANHIPFVDPRGEPSTTSGGEANHIPWADPRG